VRGAARREVEPPPAFDDELPADRADPAADDESATAPTGVSATP
jgi:hypothetical protein